MSRNVINYISKAREISTEGKSGNNIQAASGRQIYRRFVGSRAGALSITEVPFDTVSRELSLWFPSGGKG